PIRIIKERNASSVNALWLDGRRDSRRNPSKARLDNLCCACSSIRISITIFSRDFIAVSRIWMRLPHLMKDSVKLRTLNYLPGLRKTVGFLRLTTIKPCQTTSPTALRQEGVSQGL